MRGKFSKIHKLGLQTNYMTDDRFSHFYLMNEIQIFIFLEWVYEGMDVLKQISISEVNKLLNYFDTIYVMICIKELMMVCI